MRANAQFWWGLNGRTCCMVVGPAHVPSEMYLKEGDPHGENCEPTGCRCRLSPCPRRRRRTHPPCQSPPHLAAEQGQGEAQAPPGAEPCPCPHPLPTAATPGPTSLWASAWAVRWKGDGWPCTRTGTFRPSTAKPRQRAIPSRSTPPALLLSVSRTRTPSLLRVLSGQNPPNHGTFCSFPHQSDTAMPCCSSSGTATRSSKQPSSGAAPGPRWGQKPTPA